MTPPAPPATITGFSHEALLYSGPAEFVDAVVPFVTGGLLAGDAVLLMLPPERGALVRAALGETAGRDAVTFVDLDEPAPDPLWLQATLGRFLALARAAGRGFRGVGQPLTAAAAAVSARQRLRDAEAATNAAFGRGAPWRLLCAYDTDVTHEDDVHVVEATHARLLGRTGRGDVGGRSDSPHERPGGVPLSADDASPPAGALEIAFDATTGLASLRDAVRALAVAAGLDRPATEEFVIAVHEIATNSLRHGGGAGVLTAWAGGGIVHAQVRDGGRLTDLQVGSTLPPLSSENGRGLWLARELCDDVELLPQVDGLVVRLAKRLHGT